VQLNSKVKFVAVAVQVFRISFIAIFCDISCNQSLQSALAIGSCNHRGSLAIRNLGLHTAIQSSPELQLFLTKLSGRSATLE
jgi:hypothetical protein